MGRILYLECSAGISGDMFAGALLDLGADQKKMNQALQSLAVGGFSTEVSRVKKAGIGCCSFSVHLDAAHENHDHDMEYLHGKKSGNTAASVETGAVYSENGNHGEKAPAGGAPAAGVCKQEMQESCRNEHGAQGPAAQEHEALEPGIHEHWVQESGMHEHGPHGHRGLKEIFAILDAADLTDGARQLARRIFEILAEAESKAHAVPLEEVHFHEVGAVDSIADITAAAVCFDDLEISEVVIPRLCEGRGTVRCQHGVLPIPVPAVVNIVEKYQIPLSFLDADGEFVTPTGAAIAAAVRTGDRLPECFRIVKAGMGAGKREYAVPGILRAFLLEEETPMRDGPRTGFPFSAVCEGKQNADVQKGGAQQAGVQQAGEKNARIQKAGVRQAGVQKAEETESADNAAGRAGKSGPAPDSESSDVIVKLETDIDDSTGQELGFVMENLFAAGARDVHYLPAYMKKNRPAWQLEVICSEKDVPAMEQIIFRDTASIGIRRQRMERTVMDREIIQVSTSWGEISVKVCRADGLVRYYPEYESVAAVCRREGLPYREVWRAAAAACEEKNCNTGASNFT